MISAIAKPVPSTDRTEESEVEANASDRVGIALFSGIGLLLSLAVASLDQLILGDWF